MSCHRVNNYGWPDPDPVSHGCNSTEKPLEVQTCTINDDCKNRKVMWEVGPWGKVKKKNVNSSISAVKKCKAKPVVITNEYNLLGSARGRGRAAARLAGREGSFTAWMSSRETGSERLSVSKS